MRRVVAIAFVLLGLGLNLLGEKSESYWNAFRSIGESPAVVFEKQVKNDRFVFLGIGGHLEDDISFPGLSQEAVDRYIIEDERAFEAFCDDVFPLIVRTEEDESEGFSPDE